VDTTGRITVKRLPRPYGDLFRSYGIEIDGVHVGSIQRGKAHSFEVPAGHHDVQLKIDFCSSPMVDLELGAGEDARLECRATALNARRAMRNGFDNYLALELVEVVPVSLADSSVPLTTAGPPPPPPPPLRDEL
jgi:hypothetical protein